jgi:hypothetical protein
MKFALIPLVCLFTSSVIAAPARSKATDLKDINLAAQHVTDALKRLDAAFGSISPRDDPGRTLNELLNIDKFLQSEIITGTGVVKRAPNVGAVEALNLISTFNTITDLVIKTADGWYSAKAMVRKVGKRDAVYRELKGTADAHAQFADAIIAKLPYAYQITGSAVKARVASSIKGALEEYGG